MNLQLSMKNLPSQHLAQQPSPVAFTLPTPPSVNDLYKNVKGIGRVKAGLYDDFIRRGVAAIRRQQVQPIAGRVLAMFGVERMSLQSDIDNRLKSLLDTIVKAGVIGDDNLVTAVLAVWLPSANGLAHVQLFPVAGPLTFTFHPSPNGASGGIYLAPQPEGEVHGHQFG